MSEFTWEYHANTDRGRFIPECSNTQGWILKRGDRSLVGIYLRDDGRWWFRIHEWCEDYVFGTADEARGVAMAFAKMGFPDDLQE